MPLGVGQQGDRGGSRSGHRDDCAQRHRSARPRSDSEQDRTLNDRQRKHEVQEQIAGARRSGAPRTSHGQRRSSRRRHRPTKYTMIHTAIAVPIA